MVRRALFSLFSALFRRIYGTRVADLIWKIPGSSRLYSLLGRENHINILCSKGDAAAIAVGADEQTEVVRTS